MTDKLKNCCIIGAGNVATHLAQALAPHIHILQIYSRNIHNAGELCDKMEGYKPQPIDSLADLSHDADLYIISVTDDAIKDVLEQTANLPDGIWVHTSGSVPIDVFAGVKERYGVFYPLQTFSKRRLPDMSRVPMMIEGSIPQVAEELSHLAETFSNDVKIVDSDARRALHVAAVFACNFVNYMWTNADELLHDCGLSIDVLKPLLQETLDKLNDLSPRDAQTGPARRNDNSTIEKHLDMLDPRRRQLYKMISDYIRNDYNND